MSIIILQFPLAHNQNNVLLCMLERCACVHTNPLTCKAPAFVQEDHPMSLKWLFAMVSSAPIYQTWGHLVDYVRTGDVACQTETCKYHC